MIRLPTNPDRSSRNPVSVLPRYIAPRAERIVRTPPFMCLGIPLPRDLRWRPIWEFFFAVILCVPFHWKPSRPTPMP
jgi:hypothetical protein